MVKKLDVLIVDDKEDITRLFVSMLGSLPKVSNVYTCKSLAEVRATMRATLVDVVVLDLYLDDTEGIETLIKFRRNFPAVPVVVVTGYDTSGLSYQCFEEGASDYLTKPEITPTLLYKSCIYAVERDLISKKGREYKDTLTSLLSTAPIGIGMAVERQIKWINNYMCDMVGYTREELEGSSGRMVYASDEEFERVGRIKYPKIYEGQSGVVETQWRKKSGETIHVLLGSTAVGPRSPSAGVIFTALDITERKEYELALTRSEEKYRTAIESAGEGILIVQDEKIKYINKRITEIFGILLKRC